MERRLPRRSDGVATWPAPAYTTSRSHSTASAPARARAGRPRSGTPAEPCWTGSTGGCYSGSTDRQPDIPAGPERVLSTGWSQGIGAEIMGRNKFDPKGGSWTDDWQGWWGDEPPFRTPVFVLTHHPRPPIELNGGTTFHFIDASPAEALEQAQEAANGLDVRIGGGVSTVRQFLANDLVDHMHLAVVPIVLGRGERLWDGLEGVHSRFDIQSVTMPSGVTHLTFTRR
jgi:dihydrofolate reductase